MSAVDSKYRLEGSILTEEDLALSFSKESQWFEKFLPKGQLQDDRSMRRGLKIVGQNASYKTLSEMNSGVHSSMF